jgi:hypothetical protein
MILILIKIQPDVKHISIINNLYQSAFYNLKLILKHIFRSIVLGSRIPLESTIRFTGGEHNIC